MLVEELNMSKYISIDTDKKRELRQKELDLENIKLKKDNDLSKKNPNHVMLFMNNNMNEMMNLDANAIKLLLYLVNIAFENTYSNMTEQAYCVVSLEHLKDATHMGKTSIVAMTKLLVKEEWIKVFKTGNANVYAINPYRFWKSADNKKFKALYNKNEEDMTGWIVRGNIVIDVKKNKE